MRPRLTRAALSAVAVGVVVSAAACGNAEAGTTAGSSGGSGRVDVVSSTNVWGDVAKAVGGDRVDVTSVISDPEADPHSFEATPRTQLAVSRADVVVENGGGYDDFMDRLRPAMKAGAGLVDAVEVSGKAAAAKAAGEELNEHVWYDFPSVKEVADRIEAALAAADPGHADGFAARNRVFQARLDALISEEDADRAADSGAGVAITEPVPLYLLDAVGATNRTPHAFSEAVEEGDDVSPAVLERTLDLFGTHAVKALVYNAQTSGAETVKVLEAARSHGVRLVPVTETLPEGEDYLSWMQKNLDAVDRALTS
jgi:zinc/manganese transport system substrate-binding protein